jgi:XapX domain-containing protein
MKAYLLSLGAGLLVGVVYSLLDVRSPAPPVVALIGLLGILLGEQIIPVGRQMITGTSIRTAWQRLLSEALPTGAAAGVGLSRAELREMVGGYYAARQWDEQGFVPEGKIQELGITAAENEGHPAGGRPR